ncbi:NAD(P)/FAD-dependent oxidoreductase [Neobacillus notoginsengisoli]|uniref:NAD(P)/FAD-dependent oxidoreductase n=1 Tax=Neobacillus notoginsengisoli TaxID=1578198 RepID=A0A417Z0L2_9BACI|nr:NAD(P)/FAD-dependent oxidoreductase [Neobacillus notoginsengisoli]RHW43441.1 NAD(P)/FAD-dependent oxidoreductase [Neobacillus notoginsengisoli]
MERTYDAIITGARLAGSTLAIYLAKAGFKVLLVDRATFPSDTLSTNTFFNNTVALLRELGVMEEVLTTNVTPVRAIKFQFEDTVIEEPIPVVDGEDTAYCIRRTYLDDFLLRRAKSEQNVTVRERFRVTDLLSEGDAVTGVKGVDASGEVEEFRASLVVGADGRNSLVRKLANSEQKISSPSTLAIYFGCFSNFQHDGNPKFEVYKRRENMVILFPTNDDTYVVTANFPLENKTLMEEFKRSPEAALRLLLIEQFPNTTLSLRLSAAKLVEPMKGLLGYENYWYKGMGRGWALVGDAICFKDPAVAQGIHDAIYGAKILADVLKRNRHKNGQWDQIADEYQQAIEAEFMVRFYMGCEISKNDPITEQQDAVNKLISSHPSVIEKFLGIYNYANEPADFERELMKIMSNLS